MTNERALRLTAGCVILISVALTHWVSPWWLLLTAFVGLNLLQSGFTNWCPPMWLFDKLGLPRATYPDKTTSCCHKSHE
ncbi:MAG: YgaP family membrane protein [Phycisphaerales bacterium]